jgi:HD-GYP domain-containing protein (c-di-GMP phosphodiesterase class II)
MNEIQSEFIGIPLLKVGMYIDLEMGWMSHPFPAGSFKVSSAKQIEIIRGLGLQRIRYFPGKSDATTEAKPGEGEGAEGDLSPVADDAQASELDANSLARKQKNDLLSEQQRNLIVCERRFGDAIRQYKRVSEQLDTQPRSAMEESLALINTLVAEMMGNGESSIRLLSESMGDKAAMHPVNVTIISLLLGKSMNLSSPDMLDLGMSAFLHDMGKTRLPDRVQSLEENFSSAEYKLYQAHVAEGVTLAKAMALTPGACQAIAQHHELIDGSGFPNRLKGDALSAPAKILSLVNKYETLCNPSRPASALTPHEALSLIFAQLKARYDTPTLSAFIRMMGVYPPGSIVQLVDDRYAIVVSVNSSRPLKPRLIVFEPGIPRDETLILDLERTPSAGIRKSLKPASLPKAALDYLSPRQRICYFFERAIEPVSLRGPV